MFFLFEGIERNQFLAQHWWAHMDLTREVQAQEYLPDQVAQHNSPSKRVWVTLEVHSVLSLPPLSVTAAHAGASVRHHGLPATPPRRRHHTGTPRDVSSLLARTSPNGFAGRGWAGRGALLGDLLPQ
jgi:hypothetical protein